MASTLGQFFQGIWGSDENLLRRIAAWPALRLSRMGMLGHHPCRLSHPSAALPSALAYGHLDGWTAAFVDRLVHCLASVAPDATVRGHGISELVFGSDASGTRRAQRPGANRQCCLTLALAGIGNHFVHAGHSLLASSTVAFLLGLRHSIGAMVAETVKR